MLVLQAEPEQQTSFASIMLVGCGGGGANASTG